MTVWLARKFCPPFPMSVTEVIIFNQVFLRFTFILVASVFKSLTLFLLPPPLQVLLESQEETSTSRAFCQHDSVVSNCGEELRYAEQY